MSSGGPLLEVRRLVQEFDVRAQGGVRSGVVQAVSDVSFSLEKGETLGLVGETGSGKSTLARAILQAPRPKGGEVLFEGVDLVELRGRELLRRAAPDADGLPGPVRVARSEVVGERGSSRSR